MTRAILNLESLGIGGVRGGTLALGGGCERTLACAPPDAALDVTTWFSEAGGVASWGNMVLHGSHLEVGEPADELSFNDIAQFVLSQLTDLVLGDACL